ncbi:LOW QUALITY PROTEIN: uncharacterized protein LRP34_013535 [Phaethornis superciliosus]
MAVIVFLTLGVLGTVQNPLELDDVLGAAMHKLMQQAELLSWKVMQLLQDVEQTQEQDKVARKVLQLSAFHWASALGAGALVFLLWVCWRAKKRSCKPESRCKKGSHSQKEEGEEVEDHDSGDTCDLGKFLADHTQWLYMTDIYKLVEDLVDELLSACQRFSGSNFKPRQYPAIGMDGVYKG